MNIIYVSEVKWHKNWFRYELLWELEKLGHRVSYVAPQRWQQYIQNTVFMHQSPNCGAKVINFHPYLRISKKYIMQEHNKIIHIIESLLSKDTVVISNKFTYCDVIKDYFGSKLKVVYDLYDRYSEYGNELYNKDPIKIERFDAMEKAAIKKCDFVLCASKTLLADTLDVNRSAVWFPNAIPARYVVAPSKMQGSSKRIGMLSDRFSRINVDILFEIARRLPDFRIELVGRDDIDLRQTCPQNVILLDFMPHCELLRHITKWSCGLAIYNGDRFNYYCCPLKYFEYSARNVPVITTPIPEGTELARLYPDVVHLAENGQQFTHKIKTCIMHASEHSFSRLARENTWEIRARQLAGCLAM